MRLARWRLYASPSGTTCARRLTKPHPIPGVRVVFADPPAGFVPVLDYRDDFQACRSPRWSAALDWARDCIRWVPA